jgi:alanine-glyoxylate transaminase/(R)-3-amino-2-methylpropionate-pyruvate transaminase
MLVSGMRALAAAAQLQQHAAAAAPLGAHRQLSVGLRQFASQPEHQQQQSQAAAAQMPPFPYVPVPYTGPSKEEVLSLRKRFLSPSELCAVCRVVWCGVLASSRGHAPALTRVTPPPPHTHTGLFHHFREPVMITEGKMQYLFDERGRRFLDVRALSVCGAGARQRAQQ